MSKRLTFYRLLARGGLLVILIGVLITYLVVVNTLPSQIYTEAQQEYLNYNYSRSIAQKAPILNIVQSDGQVAAAILPGQDSKVRATLAARYEEQDGVSVTVYDLDFYGEYQLTHTDPTTTTVELFFPFPGNLETLHNVSFLVDGAEPAAVNYTTSGINWQTMLAPNEAHELVITYKADGANSFTYGLPHNQRSNIDIVVTVLGLAGSEIPRNSLPATTNEAEENDEIFTWQYTGLIADRDIQLSLPSRLSFAQRVARLQDDFSILAGLAPFLICFFLVALFGLLRQSKAGLSPEAYLLIGCGLALFYPLLTFLSGLLDVTLAALLAFILIAGLLMVFLGRAVGWRKIWWRVSLLLIIFLGIFSLGMLTPWRGLLLTFGGLFLVGMFMLLNGRRWVAAEPDTSSSSLAGDIPELEPAPTTDEIPPALADEVLYCPYCARTLADDHNFCPGCGHDTSRLRRCTKCGRPQFIPAEDERVYCLSCGQVFG
ncbi:MAG: hypothetical protein JXM69_16040 [Anaerolineae bacterium]|nr:hypothetical protein [Anaerolineae bacterium]